MDWRAKAGLPERNPSYHGGVTALSDDSPRRRAGGYWGRLALLAWFAAAALPAACRRPQALASQQSNADDRVAVDEPMDDLRQALTAEVLEGYERGNDPFALELGDYLGIGVGPADLWSAPEDFTMPFAIYGRGYSNRFFARLGFTPLNPQMLTIG